MDVEKEEFRKAFNHFIKKYNFKHTEQFGKGGFYLKNDSNRVILDYSHPSSTAYREERFIVKREAKEWVEQNLRKSEEDKVVEQVKEYCSNNDITIKEAELEIEVVHLTLENKVGGRFSVDIFIDSDNDRYRGTFQYEDLKFSFINDDVKELLEKLLKSAKAELSIKFDKLKVRARKYKSMGKNI